jgi:hypothetical protein
MSRNIGEYLTAIKPIEKEPKEPEVENDQVEMSSLTDEEYTKVISKM